MSTSSLTPQQAHADKRSVETVRIIVHTTGPAGPNISDNHWSIFLLLHNGESVRVNMAAEPGYINGELRWSKHNYQLSTSAIRHWDFQVRKSVRVCDIASLLYRQGRHLYDMSGGGSGCRWWMYVMSIEFDFFVTGVPSYTVLSDWCTQGWLENAATALWPDLLFRYHTSKDRIPLQMVRGEFQSPPKQKK